MRNAVADLGRKSPGWWAPLAGVVLASFLVLGAPTPAQAGWDGEQEIRLGDMATAEFAADPLVEVHRYRFFAPAGTRMRGAVRVVPAASIVPEIKLFTLGHDEVPLPLSGTRILPYHFEQSGEFYIQVRAIAGIGEYKLVTRARYPVRFRSVTEDGELDISAVAGTVLAAARVRRARGSSAVPIIDALEGRFGAIPVVEGPVLRRVRLPFSSDYVIEWRDDGGGGPVVANARLRTPRRVRAWFLGVTDPPPGPSDIMALWESSGHADRTADAFRHWDEDGAVSARCARCHSTHGFRDFIGDDGTPANYGLDPVFREDADNDAPLGTTVECDACHNPTAVALDAVVFPSLQVATGLGAEARCMTCHQGRESTVSLNEHIESKSPTGDDDVTAGLSFRNIHYFAAGGTLYGGGAMAAYQYAGKTYDGKNPHVKAYDTCIECHNPHSLAREISDGCSKCHKNRNGQPVADNDDLRDIRMQGSPLDYDGDGKSLDSENPDNQEGMYYELETMGIALYAAMQDYATAVAGAGIVYDSHAYPYFFTDTDGDGEPDPGETNFGNRYSTWTPNLLRAAYNYQYWQKDPGNFAHNPKYMLQILYDSLENLDSHDLVDVPNFENMLRSDTGHFDGQARAFRRWDRTEEDEFGNEQQVGGIDRGEVRGSCVRCHSPGGFDFYATYGLDVTVPQKVGDGLECETCHVGDDFGDPSPKRRYIPEVEFPSGVVIENDSADPDDSFICMSCHKGRESKTTVDERIAQGRPTFRNIHYLPAGSTLYGADVGVAYEFDGKSYAGKWGHFGPGASDCVTCHLPSHTFLPQMKSTCNFCHPEAGGDITRIRRNQGGVDTIDYDGDEDATERLKDELAVYGGRVLVAMQDYAAGLSNETVNKFIVYSEHQYPYWMKDLDRDRVTDENEEARSNAYASWDAPLARAAFNYQYWKKEPGFWAHNSDYAFQILYDTIEHLGGDTDGLYRPPGPDDE